jgi:hypothetical protein
MHNIAGNQTGSIWTLVIVTTVERLVHSNLEGIVLKNMFCFARMCCSFGEGWKGPCFLNYVLVLHRFALSNEATAMSSPPMLFFQKLLSESSLGIREATSHV